MRILYFSFTEKGFRLACRIADEIGGDVFRSRYAGEMQQSEVAEEMQNSSDGGKMQISRETAGTRSSGEPDETQQSRGETEAMQQGRSADKGRPLGVMEWTAEHFNKTDAIIYVGAAGIAVRAIAPHLRDKTTDPAVIVMDEAALHVIPILSGHLGGANELARRIAGVTGSDCVITTATDVNDIFAVDEWAVRQNCLLTDPKKIVKISGALLSGREISVSSRWKIEGDRPENVVIAGPSAGDNDDVSDDDPDNARYDAVFQSAPVGQADIVVDIKDLRLAGRNRPLQLVPRICVLGIGCRRGIPAEDLEEGVRQFLDEAGIHIGAVAAAATIDLKKDEQGLIRMCSDLGWEMLTYSGEELRSVEGDFASSDFVRSVTGVDNVCERSAVLASGAKKAAIGKTVYRGIRTGLEMTLALAVREYRPTWEWKRGFAE